MDIFARRGEFDAVGGLLLGEATGCSWLHDARKFRKLTGTVATVVILYGSIITFQYVQGRRNRPLRQPSNPAG